VSWLERIPNEYAAPSDRDTLIIANGFGCREQIEQGAPRRALHLAEVIRLAMNQSSEGQ
jgi:hypothetical protein